ncbi:MAG: hypothetical protein JNK82_32725 [Myxococcaceae bacterium]|nr:hypothetical protein [Myxococcaceae bacterium]
MPHVRVIGLLVLLAPAAAFATSAGVVGYSGKSTVFCTACHGVGAGAAPTVALEGPTSLTTGQVATYTLRITGGPGSRGGLNVAASTAAVGLAAGTGMVLEGGELRHTEPKAFSGGSVSWSFFVTAPPSAGTFTLFGAGNSCNGSGSGGDRSATTTRVVTVTAANQPPTITAAPSVAVTSPTTRTLAVVATDDGAQSALTYTWEASTAPQPVTFSVNGNNAARTTVATFTRAGAYTFVVTVRDAAGLTAVRTVDVTVAQAVTSASVQPTSAGVPTGGTQAFTASAVDQFGAAVAPAPAFTWAVSGGGTVSATGVFTAGTTTGGPHTVTATAGGQSATAQVTVANGTPPNISGNPTATPSGRTAALSVTATDDGGESALIYTWSATGPAAVTFAPNGTNAAKGATATFTRAGMYVLNVVARDAAGLTDTATVTLNVAATPTALTVTPAMSTVPRGGKLQLAAVAIDPFDQPVATMPAVTWALSGGGTISATGLVTAGAVTGGPHTVTATAGTLSGTATLLVSSGGPPTLVRAPQASPAQVLGRTTLLTVLANDDTGESNLVYRWSSTGPGEVLFSDDGTNDGKTSVATFTKAGAYTLTVTVEDPSQATVSGEVEVVVTQSLTGVSISPGSIAVAPNGTHQFTSRAFDQFGNPQVAAPAMEWSVTGGGTIDSAGLFAATTAEGGPWAVRVRSPSGLRASAELIVGAPRDVTPPAVTIISHEAGASLAGKVEVLARASDEGGVMEVVFKVGDTEVGQGLMNEAGDFALALETFAFANGSYPLVAVAKDAAGNQAESPAVSVQVENRSMELKGQMTGCSSTGLETGLLALLVIGLGLLRRRNGGHARSLQSRGVAPAQPARPATRLAPETVPPGQLLAPRLHNTEPQPSQVNLMTRRAHSVVRFSALAAVLVAAAASAQATPEARARCATRLSAAILAQPPTAAQLGAMDPQSNVDAMLQTPVFRERFSRFINAKMNGEPGATPAEDASYYLAKYVLENDRPWRELFNGPYRVNPGATATADAVVVSDTNGLGYFRSRAWMVRYAGNEIDGYRIVAAYRIMNNVLGLKLVAAVNTDGIDAAGRQSAACSGCHYNTTFGLDYAAKILSRKFGEGDAMTFGAPNEGPQPLLGGQMISNDAQLVNQMVASTDFRFNVCRTAMEYLYARAEFKCEGPVFDACMTAFQGAGTMTAALGAIAKAPGFCQ